MTEEAKKKRDAVGERWPGHYYAAVDGFDAGYETARAETRGELKELLSFVEHVLAERQYTEWEHNGWARILISKYRGSEERGFSTWISDKPLNSADTTDEIHVIEYSAYEAMKNELEVERMRLAACGVAAMQNTKDSKAKRIDRSNPYWSASYGDVCRAVDAEIAERQRNEKLVEALGMIDAVGMPEPYGRIVREALAENAKENG